MTLFQFFGILVARWKVALAIFLAVVGTVAVINLFLPKTYSASASLVVEVKPDPISQMLTGTSQGYMATQVEILQSDRVARRVVRNLNLNANTAMRESWQLQTGGATDFEGWMAGVLSRGLEVRPSSQSSVITVAYKSQDPRFSTAIANAFVQAYVDTTVDLRVDPAKQYSTFFDARSRDLREQVEKAQTKLSDFQRTKGIVSTDERLDVEMARMNDLSSQLVGLQSISAESGSRLAQAGGRSSDSLQDVLANGLVSGLKGDLARQEANYQQLTNRLGDNHPQVVEAKAVMADMRRKIEVETRRVTAGVGVSNTINRQREAEIRAAFEAQRAKVLHLKETHDEAGVLQRDVENAQRAYDAVVGRLNQQSLESQTTQTNVAILSRATEPTVPTGPRTTFNLLLAVFGGTLLGVLSAFALEMLNRKVRTLEDVTQSLGLPVIGVMPGPDRRRLLGRRPQTLMAHRMLGRLPMPSTK